MAETEFPLTTVFIKLVSLGVTRIFISKHIGYNILSHDYHQKRPNAPKCNSSSIFPTFTNETSYIYYYKRAFKRIVIWRNERFRYEVNFHIANITTDH